MSRRSYAWAARSLTLPGLVTISTSVLAVEIGFCWPFAALGWRFLAFLGGFLAIFVGVLAVFSGLKWLISKDSAAEMASKVFRTKSWVADLILVQFLRP